MDSIISSDKLILSEKLLHIYPAKKKKKKKKKTFIPLTAFNSRRVQRWACQYRRIDGP